MQSIDSKIAAMWKAGKTSSEIAWEVQITRSAVMGRVNRMRAKGLLEFRGPANTIKTKQARPKEPGRAAMSYKTPAYPPKPQIRRRKGFDVKPARPVKEAPPLKHVTLMELTTDHCRYIVGSHQTRGTLYCGEPKEERSYCKAHHSICYYAPRKDDRPKRRSFVLAPPQINF